MRELRLGATIAVVTKEVRSVPVLEKWTPFGDFDIERRMRRTFEDFGFLPALPPAADIYETKDEFVVELEVPGFDEKELEIQLTDHTLSVKGEQSKETAKAEKTMRLHERLQRTFNRRFELPVEADVKNVKAVYEKGVLTLHVPKTATTKPTKVEITKK